MQLDMHYYGTYALARAAGLKPDAAQTVATCAQFVDDNVARTSLRFRNGARVVSVATAHHALDTTNLDSDDQRRVWIPFHFIPGNLGPTFEERLKCRKDSPIARTMVDHHLTLADRPFALELMGIAAHVYADTFAHYGFAGISCEGNRIENDKIDLDENLGDEMTRYVRDKEKKLRRRRGGKRQPSFRDNARGNDWLRRSLNTLKSWVGENASGALGHGSVATYPDRPYLRWSFNYEHDDADLLAQNPANGRLSDRDNVKTFLEGAEALHGVFVRLRQTSPALDEGDGRDFAAIRDAVSDILGKADKKQGRIDAWQSAAGDGSVFGNGDNAIPAYGGQSWNDEWDPLDGGDDATPVRDHSVWRFYQAAAVHRTFVLRELLPAHGLVVH